MSWRLLPPEPCNECGGTVKRHAGNCPRSSYNRPRGRRRYGGPKACGKSIRKAGKMTTHIDHVCKIPLAGSSPHPGSHVCSVPGCEVTWG